MNHLRPFAALAAAGLLLAGCSMTTAAPAGTVPSGSNRPAASATSPTSPASAAPQADASTAPANDGVAAFGTAYTWEDGVSMTVGKPEAYKASKYAAGADAGKPVVVQVTLVNKSGKPFDPMFTHLSAQSANEEATSIFDSENKVSGPPSTKILDGREVTFKVAFAVANPNDVVVEASPGMLYDSVLFTS